LISAIFALAKAIFGRLSLCSLIGAIVGGISGFLFGLLIGQFGTLVLTGNEILRIGLILAVVGWLAVLLIVGVWLRYRISAIFLISLINAVLTAVLTVYFNYLIQQPILATLIGLLIGILVGVILCWFCRRRDNRRLAHG
jgi:hypothetical protein